MDPYSSKLGPLIKIEEFWVCFTAVSSIPMLVLQWWFHNLVLEILVLFPNLETKKLISGILILKETWPTFDKNALRRLQVWTNKNRLLVLRNGYHSHRWLSYPLLRSCRSNCNVIVIEDHLKLVERVHIFCLDLTLLDLEVCSFTSICLKVLTRSSQNLPMYWWLIRDKMLLRSLKKMKCKRLIWVVDLYRGGDS